jgi:CP family cyanate transporter-like MFS transporter
VERTEDGAELGGARAIPLLVAMLFIAAVTLRPPIVGLGPLIPEIRPALGLSHTLAGLLVAVPVACLGIFALPAGWVIARFGLVLAMAGALAGAASFGMLRAASADAVQLFLGTVGTGAALGLAGALLPGAVKAAAPGQAGLATGVYAVGIQLGAALAGIVAVPLSIALGGWRGSIAAMSAVCLLACVAWLMGMRRALPLRPARVQHLRLPFGRWRAWHLAALFSINSICFWGLTAWLPSYYVERGWTGVSAGLLIAVMNLAALPATIIVPWLSDRRGVRRPFLAASGIVLALAIAGVLVAPDAAVAWMIIGGVAIGAMFTLTLTLPVDIGERPVEVAGLAAIMLAGGYVVAAGSPAMLGWVRDLTGSFTVSLGALAVIALLQLPLVRFLPHRI